ncbi:MAG: M23 family metallopeptidase [Spirochaetota bacterium]
MKMTLFQLMSFALSALILPLEAQAVLSTTTLRQGEPAFLLFFNNTPRRFQVEPSILYSIRQALTQTGSPMGVWRPAAGAWQQTGFKARVSYANGGSNPVSTGFPLPVDPGTMLGKYWDYVSIDGMDQTLHARWDLATSAVLFLLGVPVDAPAGEASIIVTGPDGREAARLETSIAGRGFRRDDIHLDEALTSLRVDQDPLKVEQARRYLALLGTINDDAVFMDRGFMRPVAGERRTSLFGDIRKFIYADEGTAWGTHNGIDYGYPTGTPVWSAGRGRVAMAEDRIVTGNTVVIEHLPGVYTIYMHLHHMAVRVGDMVERKQAIGTIGATGLATGPHLHWELRVSGVACDPEALAGLDKMPRIRTMTAAIEGR